MLDLLPQLNAEAEVTDDAISQVSTLTDRLAATRLT